jgi:hypothetical protein
VEWLKVKALSSSPSTGKEKKRKRKNVISFFPLLQHGRIGSSGEGV